MSRVAATVYVRACVHACVRHVAVVVSGVIDPPLVPRCSFVNADLRRRGLEEVVGAAGAPLRLVHGCRFLDVELLCRVPQLLAPQGLFVWSTFQAMERSALP